MTTDELEIWKRLNECEAVKGYDGLYSITKDGRVYSHRGKKFLTPLVGHAGYLHVHLAKYGEVKYTRISRLVCAAYHDNPENKPFVNHIDGNKLNNHYDNLEWCTNSENTIHAYNTGLMASERTGNAKLKNKDVLLIRALKGTMPYGEIANVFGVTFENISLIMRGLTWQRL